MVSIFETLSDDEIRAELVKRGISAGPITPTTRKLYVKKLQNSQQQNDEPQEEPQVLNFDQEESEEEETDHSNGSNGVHVHVDASGDHGSPDLTYEDSSINYPKLTGNDSVDLRVTRRSLQQPARDVSDEDDHIESSRILTPEEVRRRRQYVAPMTDRRIANKKKQTFISYVCLFAFGAVLAVLFANMFIFPFFEKQGKPAVHDEI